MVSRRSVEGSARKILCVLYFRYIRSAREGVRRLGSLLEQYSTYEMNGIAFQDQDEIWWLETIGGHHWMARRVPDDVYVVMPNQLGIDRFDFSDALGEQKEYMCSADLEEFVKTYHLDLHRMASFIRATRSAAMTMRIMYTTRRVRGSWSAI